jgi:hypothetical protein
MDPKDFEETFGIPKRNGGGFDFLVIGRLLPGRPAVTRVAPGSGGNPGGAIEVVTNPNTVKIEVFTTF